MIKTRRFFFTLASSSVLAVALGVGAVFADSCGSSGGCSSGGWSYHGGDSSGGGFLHFLLHAVQQIAGAYPKGSTPLGSGH